MRAVVFDQHGAIENLRYTSEHPTPVPQRGEVRVKIAAAALNRLDLWVREGWVGLKLPMPHIPGADAAGVVDQLGEGVEGWTPGDRVVINPMINCGTCLHCLSGQQNLCANGSILGEDMAGTYAEYICVLARNLLKLPDSVSYAEAAAAALVYLTAWHSLITRGGLAPGQSLLIVGAGGGVNSASIQIGKLMGATVYVVGSTAEKLAQAQSLGADIMIDRSKEDWVKAVYKLTGKRGADVIVDNVGKETLPGALRAAARGGKILIVGNTSGALAELDIRYIFSKHLSILGSTMSPHSDFVTVMNLVFSGKLKPIIGARFPLEQAADAQRTLTDGTVFGKVILEV